MASLNKGAVRQMLNLCANNYMELATDPDSINGAIEAIDRYGAGWRL